MPRVYLVEGLLYRREDNSKIFVAVPGPKTQKVLRHVASFYMEQSIHARSQFRGEWRWCGNPNCVNVMYIPKTYLRQGYGSFCSRTCEMVVYDPREQIIRVHEVLRVKALKRMQATCCRNVGIESPSPIDVDVCRACRDKAAKGRSKKRARCKHLHWCVESPNGPTSLGTCRNCGLARAFSNSIPNEAQRLR